MEKVYLGEERVGAADRLQELGLYIHIPFCRKKCDYCDFLSAPASEDTQREYMEALIVEIQSHKGSASEYVVSTVFIGGGTPSAVSSHYINDIMDVVNSTFNVDRQCLEATIEVNPGTVNREKLDSYKKAGINRLSFGLQSAHNRELQLLGRIHTYEEFKENYDLAREAGYQNINIDLMSALPGQTMESWERTLHLVTDLKPEHIAAYSLIIEEGTPFYDRYNKDTAKASELPGEDEERRMYYRTGEILKEAGYLRYEISNYARKGYESRHNSSYWTGTEYLGLGLGASSLYKGARFHNQSNIKEYSRLWKGYKRTGIIPAGLQEEYEILTRKQQMEEFMFLGLRMCKGVSREAFQRKFAVDMEYIYQTVIERLVKAGLLVSCGDRLALTDYGIDVSNYALAAFLQD